MNKRKGFETARLLSAGFALVVIAGSGLAGAQQSAPGDESFLVKTIVAPMIETPEGVRDRMVVVGSDSGLVPVAAVGESESAVTVDIRPSAQHRAYGFVVRPRESLQVRLEHPLKSYFSLLMVDRFGHPLPLTLERQNMSGVPQASFVNTTGKDVAAYVVAQYVDWAYEQGANCTLRIERERR